MPLSFTCSVRIFSFWSWNCLCICVLQIQLKWEGLQKFCRRLNDIHSVPVPQSWIFLLGDVYLTSPLIYLKVSISVYFSCTATISWYNFTGIYWNAIVWNILKPKLTFFNTLFKVKNKMSLFGIQSFFPNTQVSATQNQIHSKFFKLLSKLSCDVKNSKTNYKGSCVVKCFFLSRKSPWVKLHR